MLNQNAKRGLLPNNLKSIKSLAKIVTNVFFRVHYKKVKLRSYSLPHIWKHQFVLKSVLLGLAIIMNLFSSMLILSWRTVIARADSGTASGVATSLGGREPRRALDSGQVVWRCSLSQKYYWICMNIFYAAGKFNISTLSNIICRQGFLNFILSNFDNSALFFTFLLFLN